MQCCYHFKTDVYQADQNQKTATTSSIISKNNAVFTPIFRHSTVCKPFADRPVTSLGHQGGRRVFWEGLKFLKLCPTHFSRWSEKFCRGSFVPCAPSWLRAVCRYSH